MFSFAGFPINTQKTSLMFASESSITFKSIDAACFSIKDPVKRPQSWEKLYIDVSPAKKDDIDDKEGWMLYIGDFWWSYFQWDYFILWSK